MTTTVTTQPITRTRQLTVEDLKSLPIQMKLEDGFLILEKSLKGHPLKNQVKVPMVQILNTGQKGLVEYIINSLSRERPKLIPFVFENNSLLKLAKHLLRYCTGSSQTLYLYIDCISRYARWLGYSPDLIIADVKPTGAIPDPLRVQNHIGFLEDFIAELQDQGLSPLRICNYAKAVKALYRVNGVDLRLPQPLSQRVVRKDRAPKPEELNKLLDMADLREKVIVSMLALGGFREGTLVRLLYRHIRPELERGIVPLHIHVEAAITKGKYHDYDTFLGQEAVDYLKLYLEERQRGSPDGKIPPEQLTDSSPLIRSQTSRTPKPIGEKQVYQLIHNLYFKAGLLNPNKGRIYDLKVHSLRKYFKTQLIALGVQPDYVDYMMGHTVDTYHDIQSLGVDRLRNIYASAGLTIKSKTKTSKIDLIKEYIRAMGVNPEEILTREALLQPARTYATIQDQEDYQLKVLSKALKETLKRELLSEKHIEDCTYSVPIQ
jgi:site-specific recombinase XerD